MATVTKDFRIKSGLVVEGTNATVNGSDLITEDAITGGTQTNITVTYNPATKTVNFVAENGIADSTTDNLVEGTNNLYFTEQRAIDAVEGAATLDLNSVSATSLTAASSIALSNGQQTVFDVNASGVVNASGTVTAPTFVGDLIGNADTASALATARTITVSGDVDGNADFDGSSNIDIAVTLDTVNQNVGSFGSTTKIPTFTVNGKGLLTAAGEVDVATNLSIAGDTGTDTVSLLTDTVTFKGGDAVTTVVTNNEVAIAVNAGNGLQITGDAVAIDTAVTVDVDSAQTLENKTLSTGTILADNIDADGYTIKNLSTPSDPMDAATKNYVDSIAAGLTWKPAVNLLATSNVPLTGDIGTLVIDGHAPLGFTHFGYRLLLTGQTVAEENGIYVFNEGVAPFYELTRAADLDAVSELDGAAVFVMEGTQYGSTSWVQSNHYATTFADQEWDQFSGAGTYLAGTNLNLDGNTFNLNDEITLTTVNADLVGDVTGNLTGNVSGGVNVPLTITSTSDAIQITASKGISLSSQDGTTLETDTYVGTAGISNNLVATQGYVATELDSYLNSTEGSEGTTILYVQDYVATAIETGDATATPTYLALDINSVAQQVAASATTDGLGTDYVVYEFDSSLHRSAKFLVKMAYGTHTQVSEILLTLDTSNNVAITEYAIVGTNGNLGNVSATWADAVTPFPARVQLTVNSTNALNVTVAGTLLA